MPGDLTEESACEELVDRAVAELGGIDVLVNTAAYQMAQPGGIDMPPEQVEGFGSDTPLGRAAQPAEMAPAFVFFASQESSYITGEVLAVTGGKPL